MDKNKMVALILAGGRGSRLYELTQKIAKPAVHFGGKYRIIDFPLSNCANSDIDTVGILVQYESILLSSYVAHEKTWGLSGVYVLPPRERASSGFDIYEGTASAIAQNIDFLKQMKAEYVLVLSGDHIYKMDYRKMLKRHIESHAEATIAVLEVPKKEASRFGIMICDAKDEIVDFEEKPEKPKSNLASMGIYIFNYKTLKKYLRDDAKNKESSHDFGKDIIPLYLREKKKLSAYRFKGYWKDVGTVDSLWEANMDLIDNENALNLFDTSWRIFTSDTMTPPQTIGKKAEVTNAYITQGCQVDGKVKHSVLFTGAIVEEEALIEDSVIMNNVHIEKGAILKRCLVEEGLTIPANTKLGNNNSDKILLVSKELLNKEGH